MSLDDLAALIPDLAGWGHSDRIKLFAWYLHTQEGKEFFEPAEIMACFDKLNQAPPSNIHSHLASLQKKKPREILKAGKGYKLETQVRSAFDKKYGTRPITLQVAKLLEDLPQLVPDLAERTFLDEAVKCFKCFAYRAAIVMAWNLAYHHLCDYIAKSPQRLAAFNARWPVRYPKAQARGTKPITRLEDFSEEWKESEMIEICSSAGLISGDLNKILTAKLGTRNSAAHPSSVVIGQLQAEEYIDSLVKNVVLKLV